MKTRLAGSLIILILILPCFLLAGPPSTGCKDIVACGDATAGDYNLLLKVRDPSRPGLQVLCFVPQGYGYTYHRPWKKTSWDFVVDHAYLGVTSEDDVIPNIVKAGMTLSTAGLAFGDADTNSGWVNPTRYAWDDFDWIRYSCEQAGTEQEAISLLTKDAVDELHATGVSENLFVVGPDKGYVIEADAFRYNIKELQDGVVVMSNYPKELWKTQWLKTRLVASSFDSEKELTVRRGRTVHLGSLWGIRILDVTDDAVVVKQVPLISNIKFRDNRPVIADSTVEIPIGDRATVGEYSVEVHEISGRQAQITVCTKYYAWQQAMLAYIEPHYGSITVQDMINWSRLHDDDLQGLRPMCEDRFEYEGVAIYQIPSTHPELLSCGWFSPNHACSSIYVPFHSCNTEIATPYSTGEAAALSLELLGMYGHDALSPYFTKIEEVFYHEIQDVEQIALNSLTKDTVSDMLTTVDGGMQRQAWYTSNIWKDIYALGSGQDRDNLVSLISSLWDTNYRISLMKMNTVVQKLQDEPQYKSLIPPIITIACDICSTHMDAAALLGGNVSQVQNELEQGRTLLDQGTYDEGFAELQKAYLHSDFILHGQPFEYQEGNKGEVSEMNLVFIIIATCILLLVILVLIRWKIR
jgi:hypothetical protein